MHMMPTGRRSPHPALVDGKVDPTIGPARRFALRESNASCAVAKPVDGSRIPATGLERAAALANYSQLPNDIEVSIAVPPADGLIEPALQYAFITGHTSQPMAPVQVEWRNGSGINTGRNVLAGADY